MTDEHDDSERIPYFVNPHALYLPNTPEWAMLAAELGVEGRKPIACIALPGSGVSPSFSHFGVQILLRANYQGLAFGDKLLRFRVFKFEQPATIEMIMAVDVLNPAQPFIEWQVWTAAVPVLAMVNIPTTQWVKEAKAFAPGFDLLVQTPDRVPKQTRSDEYSKETARIVCLKVVRRMAKDKIMPNKSTVAKYTGADRKTISKWYKRDTTLEQDIMEAYQTALDGGE
jgi:hypothetical protein